MSNENLTALQVKHMKPAKKRFEVPAGPPSGLYLVVHPTGRKSWMFRYRFDGRTRGLTLSEGYPVCGLAQARAETEGARAKLREGVDPAANMRLPEPESPTFGAVVDEFMERYAKRNQRSWRETQRILETEAVSKWGSRPIEQVRRPDILRLLDGILDRGAPVMANRTHSALARLFNWSMERGITVASPMANVRSPGTERSRDRVLSVEEICEVWIAAKSLGYPFGPLFHLLLLTAQRRGEVAKIRWSDVDLRSGLWALQKEATKAGRAHDVPLSDDAVRLLAELPRFDQEGFVLTTTAGVKPITGFSKAKARIDRLILEARREHASDRGEDPGVIKPPLRWTYHDLRRTAATYMAKTGTPPHVLASLLNHSPGRTLGISAIYIRHRYLQERREALEAWAEYLVSLLAERNQGTLRALALSPIRKPRFPALPPPPSSPIRAAIVFCPTQAPTLDVVQRLEDDQ